MNAGELYRDGKLTEAIEAVQQEIKRQATDTGKRISLSELLLFAGQWERADKQLEIVVMQAPEMAVVVALMRQLIRGEVARQQFFAEGRSPSFLSEEDSVVRSHLQAAVAVRGGAGSEVPALLAPSEQLASSLAGSCNGKPFQGLRDLDDLLGPILEVITPNGKYYWINMKSISSLEFHPPQQMHDLIWRRATAAIQDGPQGDIYIPALYAGSHTHEDDLVRLGRRTDWTEGTLVRGVGQREFLVGDEAIPILALEQLSVAPAHSAAAEE